MTWFRRRLPLMLIAAMCWLVGAFSSQVHQITVRHEVCEEHGEIFELDGSGKADRVTAFTDASAQADHDDGCSLPALPAPCGAATLPCVEPPPFEPTPYHALAGSDARVVGPLRYAPKTSPPVV